MNAPVLDHDLVTIPRASAMQVFTNANAIDPYLKVVRDAIDAFKADPVDLKTDAGRKRVASFARQVAASKVALENVGKALADEAKALPKKIDATRKTVRDTLDAWRDEVRQPLTDWEVAEESRKARHAGAIEEMRVLASMTDLPSAHMKDNLSAVQAVLVGPECEEFEDEYRLAKAAALRDIEAAIAKAEKHEADQAELARLRFEAAERAERDRVEAEKKAAEDRAREIAETALETERLRVQEAARRAEQEAADRIAKAEADAQAEREASARRDQDARDAIARAEQRARDAEEQVRREAAAERARQDEEQARRATDTAHRGKINRAALDALVAEGIAEDVGRLVVTAIAQQRIPHITITY